jgi:hypothetical protein
MSFRSGLGSFVLGAVCGAGLMGFYLRGLDLRAELTRAHGVVSPPLPPRPSVLHDAGVLTDGGAPSDGGDAGRVGPPDGALPVPGGIVLVGQPDRRAVHWPEPLQPRAVPAAEVWPFALDVTPVTAGAYDQCVHGLSCTAIDTRGCRDAPYRDEDPVTCATWAQAEAYCTWLRGRLPSIAEWEQAAAMDAAFVLPENVPFEWVADRYPASVFERGPSIACNDEANERYDVCRHARIGRRRARRPPRFEWGVTGAVHRLDTYTFRCAYTR